MNPSSESPVCMFHRTYYPGPIMMKRNDILCGHRNGKWTALGTIVVVSILLSLSVISVSADVIVFPDPGLETAIREVIGKAEGDLYVVDLLELESLTARDLEIASLEGIQHCTNLTYLNVLRNEIIDISPLEGLINLASLNLNGNQIIDISPLSGLVGLTTLQANTNSIADISPLANLVQLTELFLSENQIIDVDALSNLVNLQTLGLPRNRIVDIGAISALVDLTYLDLNDNQIQDIQALVDNTGWGDGDDVESVYISGNYLDTTEGSPDMSHIEILRDRGVDISYGSQNPLIVVFPDHELEVVIRDVIDQSTGEILSTDLIGLTELDVEDWGVISIEGIQHCVNLEWLDLRDNEIGDIGALEGLVLLSSLNISNNEIMDIDALENLLNLTELSLYNNQIVDISLLAGLPHLEQLDLSGNQIADIAPLVANRGIGGGDSIDLRWNKLDLQPGSQDMLNIESLQARGVSVIYLPQD